MILHSQSPLLWEGVWLMTVRKPTLCIVVQLTNVVLVIVKRVDIYVKQIYLKVMLQTKFIV